jgi:hypothetical protein
MYFLFLIFLHYKGIPIYNIKFNFVNNNFKPCNYKCLKVLHVNTASYCLQLTACSQTYLSNQNCSSENLNIKSNISLLYTYSSINCDKYYGSLGYNYGNQYVCKVNILLYMLLYIYV